MKKLFFGLTLVLVNFIFFTKIAIAVCPVCTVAVGTGIGFSRWLGIDDSITGLWLGGLIVSLIIWTLNWFDKKNLHFYGRTIITVCVYYFFVIVSFYLFGVMDNCLDTFRFFGKVINRLWVGMAIGSIAFWFGASCYSYLKKRNHGKAYFPFQKVVMPIIPLIILSIIFYLFIK